MGKQFEPNMILMEEPEVVERILNGEQELFAEVVRAHQVLVFRTCMGFTRSSEDAEDLTQEVFISAYQQLRHFKGDSKLSTWLYRIAVNASLNYVRSSKKRSIFQYIEGLFVRDKAETMTVVLPTSDNPERQLIAIQEKEAIEQAIDLLPENQRVAFTLSKYDELPQAEIAAVMGISEGAVEQLLQRAKSNLRKKLVAYYKK